MKKTSNFQRRIIRICLTLLPHDRRAGYLKKKDIFYHFGDDVKWVSTSIPAEPYLVSIGNNVRIAQGVSFITHDIINGGLSKDPTVEKIGDRKDFGFHMGTIEVGNHVMIGAGAVILPGKKIGSHVIIAACSVITKDVPDGVIVGGNPAKIIGDYYKLASARVEEYNPSNHSSIDDIINYYWRKEQ